MEEFRSRPLDYRVHECKRLAHKYQDRVPIIIRPGNARTPDVPNFRYLVPKDKTVGEFVAILRRTAKLKSHQALFVLVGKGTLPTTTHTMLQVYQEHHEEDGFLYVTYTLENTFG
jgi:GABA(A) receptor-associated protein